MDSINGTPTSGTVTYIDVNWLCLTLLPMRNDDDKVISTGLIVGAWEEPVIKSLDWVTERKQLAELQLTPWWEEAILCNADGSVTEGI